MGGSQHTSDSDSLISNRGDSQSQSSDEGNEIVIPANAAHTDNVPTVISKGSNGNVAASQKLENSLRGRTLAHFELIEPIGVGGMAAVVKARDCNLDRLVALKILPPEMAAEPENVKRFHQEAHSAAKLDHENIARVFFCGEDKGLHFIAYEYVEGANLMTLLRHQGPLPVSLAIQYILDVIAGLAHAANRGVVHRDVKPSNIIIDPRGRAKLVDMGLARILETHKDKGLTHSGVTLGTFDYISPEQALEPREADLRSDIYSLGCTFYHMLTGNTPVPDGTAAKKLRFHQHEAPLDPREINPAIPDSVAAILAKMMAKKPQDRYQNPDDLIEHLRHVADKLGVSARHEPRLLPRVPLPHEPRTRPFWWIACAVVAFGLLLIFLSFFPGDLEQFNESQTAQRTKDAPKRNNGKEKRNDFNPTEQTPLLEGDTVHIWNDPKDLKKLKAVFESERQRHVVKLHDTLDLSDQHLVFKGDHHRSLIVESSDEQEPRTIRLKYSPAQKPRKVYAGIVIEGGHVLFRNLRFEIESNVSPIHIVAAIVIKNAVVVTFDRCTFVQTGFHTRPFLDAQSRELMPLASIAVDQQYAKSGSVSTGPLVNLHRCYFEKGQVAIALRGVGRIAPTNCAFGPHSALFHLSGKSERFASQIAMKDCSAHVVHGPVFRIDDQASCRLNISSSVFSQPSDASLNQQGDARDFIYQRDAQEPVVKFEGKRNVYHNLNAFWVWPRQDADPVILAKFADFKAQVAQLGGSVGPHSSVLEKERSPWLEDSQHAQAEARSFRLDPLLPELRQLDGNQLTTKAIGVQECAWGPMARDLPTLVKTDVVELGDGQLVVNPQTDGKNKNERKSLREAINIALNKPGVNVISIMQTSKTERIVKVESVRLDKPDVKIVLKPHKNHRPLLTLDKTNENDAEMFYLSGGELVLQDLEFTLNPDRREFNHQSIIKLGGAGGNATMKNCVFTLKDSFQIPLSIVMLRHPKNVMPMELQSVTPQIKVEKCFVRGEGDFLRSNAGQPFRLEMRDSLLGISGSLIDVHSGSAAKPFDTTMVVELSKVSAFFDNSLVTLHANAEDKYIVPTHLKSLQDCLFHSLNGKPLVQLDGFDLGIQEEKLPQILKSSTLVHNAYSNMPSILAYDGPPGTFPIEWNKDEWVKWTGEDEAVFPEEAKFKFQPLVTSFSEVSVSGFQVESSGSDVDLKTYGVPPNQVQGPTPNAMPNTRMDEESDS